MKIAVTGGAGFVGSAVVRKLMALNNFVRIVDDMSTGREANLPYPGILRQSDAGIADYIGFDAIIHAAAYATIRGNWDGDERTKVWYGNADLTRRVLDHATGKRFIFLSTAALEDGCKSPYAAAKLAAESLVQAYHYAGRIRGSIIRLVSAVGRNYARGHIADFVRMAYEGTVHAVDNGRQRKNFVHVDDVADYVAREVELNSGLEVTPTVVASSTRWSWRDTVRTMRLMRPERKFLVVHSRKDTGWVGDPHNLMVLPTLGCDRSVAAGVVQSLESLGW